MHIVQQGARNFLSLKANSGNCARGKSLLSNLLRNILLTIYYFNLKVFVKYKWVFSSKNFQIHCPWCSGKVHLRSLSCCLHLLNTLQLLMQHHCSSSVLMHFRTRLGLGLGLGLGSLFINSLPLCWRTRRISAPLALKINLDGAI